MALAFTPPTETWQPRARCLRCRRPEVTCYCARIPRLDTETRVVILQHARERDMPIGTARMASLCLANSELHVGVRWDHHAPLARALANPAAPPILLYPGPGAKDILRDPPAGPVTLVVVDGTWSQAKTVVRDNPVLHALPRYAFAAPELSRYRIRKEPRPEYCSTIEALMHVLGALERDPARFRALLEPFEAMIDAQLAAAASAPKRGARQLVKKRVAQPRVPAAIRERFADLVIVVGEANAFPYDPERAARVANLTPDEPGRAANPSDTSHQGPTSEARTRSPYRAVAGVTPDEPIHWLALRPATGELFDRIIRPTGPLSPSAPFHAELTGPQILAGVTRADAAAAFAAWSRPTDQLAAWGTYAPALFDLPALAVDLRLAAARIENRRVGALEHYAPDVPALAPGRGGKRLAMLAALCHRWHALPT